MYEQIRQKMYALFARKCVRIEFKEIVDSPNFCCLKIRYKPEQGMTLIIGKFIDED